MRFSILVALRVVVVVQSSSSFSTTTTTTTTRASLARSKDFFSVCWDGQKKSIFISIFFLIQMFRVFYWKRKPPVPFVIITQRLSDGLFFASDTNSTRKTPTKDNNAMMGGEHSSLGFVSVSSSSRLSSRAGTTGWRTRAATAHRIRLQKRGKRGGDCLVVRDRAATYGEEPAFRRKESKGGGRGRGGRGAIAFACVLVRF